MSRLIDIDVLINEIKYSKNKPIICDDLDEILWIEECLEKAPIILDTETKIEIC